MCEGETLPMDEDGSAERQIQSVFDFLDEPDDLNRGLEYWGANPRHSLTEQEDDDEILEHKTVADSSDDDVRESLSLCPSLDHPACLFQDHPSLSWLSQVIWHSSFPRRCGQNKELCTSSHLPISNSSFRHYLKTCHPT